MKAELMLIAEIHDGGTSKIMNSARLCLRRRKLAKEENLGRRRLPYSLQSLTPIYSRSIPARIPKMQVRMTNTYMAKAMTSWDVHIDRLRA